MATAPPVEAPAAGRRYAVRRGVLAVLAGLLLYAAHPPLEWGWLGLVALAPLVALGRDVAADTRPMRAGLLWGFGAGVLYFALLLVWLRNVDLSAWLFLAPVQAIFVALFVAGLALWGTTAGRGMFAVVLWVGLEALRSSAPLGGFPWGVLGYTQAGGGPFLEAARTVGVLGVSALCAGVAVCVEAVIEQVHRVINEPGATLAERVGERAFGAARVPLLSLLGLLVAAVLLSGEAPAPAGQQIDTVGIQGFDVEGSTGRALPRSLVIAEKMLEVTEEAVEEGGLPELTVWPENALDGDVVGEASPELAGRLSEALDVLDGGPLLAGVIQQGPRPETFFNTQVLFGSDGQVADAYTKRKLVPFGEYVPARGLLDWYPPLGRVPSDGLPGTEPGVIEAAGARIGTVICFEVIFPDLVHSQVREGADLLVVSTNNSSFGRGAASRQHIAFSQLRAVETGRWVLHAALSGSSAIVDPQGRVLQRTGLYEQAVVRADLPLVRGTTIATRLGDWPGWVALALALAGVVFTAWRRRADGSG